MQSAYEFNEQEKVVKICSWHSNSKELEEKAAKEHPGIRITHGICQDCIDREMNTNSEDLECSKDWIEDARKEIAALYA